MRQSHIASRCSSITPAQPLEVINPTGAARTAQLFIAVLGVSNYTYAEATWTQGLSDWIGSHTRSFAFFSGFRPWWCPTICARHHQSLFLRAGGQPQLR